MVRSARSAIRRPAYQLLQLPDGFKYWSHSWTGDLMTDGVRVPSLHDEMAVVDEFFGSLPRDNDLPSCEPGDDRDRRFEGFTDRRDNDRRHHDGDDHHRNRTGRLILVRNHERAVGAPYVDDPSITYAGDGAGGTTNVIFNPGESRWEKVWSSGFSRLEGAWWGDRTGFFLTTNGGVGGEGQVFEYDPRAETLTLIYDAPNADARQPRQHDGHAARRLAFVRRRRRQQLHRRGTAGRTDARR